MFVAIAFTGFNADNFADFAPKGVAGITAAAGHDLLHVHRPRRRLDRRRRGARPAEDDAARDPRRPRRSSPSIYVLVAVSALGTQPWQEFGDAAQGEAGLAKILQDVVGASWPGTILSAGAVISIFSVTLVTMYGQTRILFAIGRDGLLPRAFARVNPRTHTPVNNTVIVAIVVGLLAAFIPLDYLWDLVSIGTLIAFIVVSRRRASSCAARAPTCPAGSRSPATRSRRCSPIAACLYILSGLHWYTYAWFLLWLAVVLAFYFLWGRKHSLLERAVEAGLLRGRGPAMTIVVGANPFGDAHGAIDLGVTLARTLPEATGANVLVVATVVPPGWTVPLDGQGRRRDAGVGRRRAPTRPRPPRCAFLEDRAEGLTVEFVRLHERSTPRALAALAEARDATALVLGSSPDGPEGRVVVGSTADYLLHSSPVPLAIAPSVVPLRARPDRRRRAPAHLLVQRLRPRRRRPSGGPPASRARSTCGCGSARSGSGPRRCTRPRSAPTSSPR